MNDDRPRWSIDPDDVAKARRMLERLKPWARRKQRELYQVRMLAKAEANRRAVRFPTEPATMPQAPGPGSGTSANLNHANAK